MGRFQPSYFQLYLLIAALLECKVVTQRPCKQVHQLTINYVQGDNMSISCLTTTHPLESLTVKLRRTNPVQHILKYPDNSSTLEHQRWSVRNYAGNVTLDLKDISLSDKGHYECQVYKYLDCLNATLFNLRVKECKILDSVHATPDSSVLLPCSEHPQQYRTDQVTWKIFHGHQPTEMDKHLPSHKPSNSTERDPRPLYERVRILGNGFLLIRDAVNTDGSWYQCRVSEKTCYEVKLVVKVITDVSTSAYSPVVTTEGNIGVSAEVTTNLTAVVMVTTLLATMITDVSTSAYSPVVTTEGNTGVSAEVTTNLTAVVMVTIVSPCVIILLIICVILYSKKQSCKFNSQIELDCWSSVSYSEISGGFDAPFNSLVEFNT